MTEIATERGPTTSVQRLVRRRIAGVLRIFPLDRSPLEFRLLGRMLLHAALVGVAAGLVGSAFFYCVEVVQRFTLERWAGYLPLRAAGERVTSGSESGVFRPWLLCLLPAIGALVAGIASQLAPETKGGGSDAIIEAFHSGGGVVRRRVTFVKAVASIFTLGFGGSGGREGPTMQMGGALGSLVGRYLRVTERERRILLVAGTGAGMAAVFRTPLGAALLAVEILHRDDFESDALVPAVLACVVSYSVFTSFFGESRLFAHAASYPFVPGHLPLYGAMAVGISIIGAAFLKSLRSVQRLTAAARLPGWLKPAAGGLLLGLFATLLILFVGPLVGQRGMGLGLLGGGYGEAQVAISGSSWLPEGWVGVELLLLLGAMKILGTSLTVGSGGSAGDFGPSLVIGGIFGGAFGRACLLVFHDPRINPGAFALVGMATLYGGLAHVPIAALVMTCELTGSYDLLVPLMLAEGIAYVALRKRSLYHAQRETKRDSPAHRGDLVLDVLRDVTVKDVVVRDRPYVRFEARTPGARVMSAIASSGWQDVFPVLATDGKLLGIVSADILRTLVAEPSLSDVAIAFDLMLPPVFVRESDDLHTALRTFLKHGIRELPVVDAEGHIIGFLDEAEVTQAYHRSTAPADRSGQFRSASGA